MKASLKQIFSEPNKKSDIIKDWPEDYVQLLNDGCRFDVQYLGHLTIEDTDDVNECIMTMKKLYCSKKIQKSILFVNSHSIRLTLKANHELLLDQPLDSILFVSSQPHIPTAFFYTTKETTIDKYQLHGFTSIKELSERIVNVIQYARKANGDLCNIKSNSKPINSVSISNITDNNSGDSSFKQTSLLEKFRDPQSAIVVPSIPMHKSNSCGIDLKSLPRPKTSTNSSLRKVSLKEFQRMTPEQIFNGLNEVNNDLKCPSQFDDNGGNSSLAADFVANFNEIKNCRSDNNTNNDADINEACSVDDKVRILKLINQQFYEGQSSATSVSQVSACGDKKTSSVQYYRNDKEEGNSKYSSFKNLRKLSGGNLGWSDSIMAHSPEKEIANGNKIQDASIFDYVTEYCNQIKNQK